MTYLSFQFASTVGRKIPGLIVGSYHGNLEAIFQPGQRGIGKKGKWLWLEVTTDCPFTYRYPLQTLQVVYHKSKAIFICCVCLRPQSLNKCPEESVRLKCAREQLAKVFFWAADSTEVRVVPLHTCVSHSYSPLFYIPLMTSCCHACQCTFALSGGRTSNLHKCISGSLFLSLWQFAAAVCDFPKKFVWFSSSDSFMKK